MSVILTKDKKTHQYIDTFYGGLSNSHLEKILNISPEEVENHSSFASLIKAMPPKIKNNEYDQLIQWYKAAYHINIFGKHMLYPNALTSLEKLTTFFQKYLVCEHPEIEFLKNIVIEQINKKLDLNDANFLKLLDKDNTGYIVVISLACFADAYSGNWIGDYLNKLEG